jgi:hypothetical protein
MGLSACFALPRERYCHNGVMTFAPLDNKIGSCQRLTFTSGKGDGWSRRDDGWSAT